MVKAWVEKACGFYECVCLGNKAYAESVSDHYPFKWLVKHCLSVITECVIQDVRQNAGLSLHQNHITQMKWSLKTNSQRRSTIQKKSELPEFVQKMSNLMHEQNQEIERAVVKSGEYRVLEEYQQYTVDSTCWFQMTSEEKRRKINAFVKSRNYRPANTH